MQELALHIEYLLRRHDCVIVPGFGAFLKLALDARYSGTTIAPAIADICFNPSVENDDGMLANSFARRLSLTFEEARIRLYEEVNTLRQTLHDTGEVTLGRLGTFSTGDENTLRFCPMKTGSERMSALGFPVISLPSIENGTPSIAESDLEEHSFNHSKNYYIAVNKIFARIAASVVLVMTVGISFWLTSGDTQNSRQYASVVPVAAIEKADKAMKSIGSTPDTVLHKNRPSIETTEEKATVTKTPVAGEYYLIVGTFRTPSEASRFIESHPGQNLTAVPSAKLVRVSAAFSSSREKLISTMQDAEFRSRFADSWIWKAD